MILSKEDLKGVFAGAVRFRETKDGLMPLRFTVEQDDYYRRFPNFVEKTYASCGMRLDFTTDAKVFFADYTTCSGSSRRFCYFDVYIDGVMVQHCGTENREMHPSCVLDLRLDGEEHRITVYLPNLSGVEFHRVELYGASYFKPMKRASKLLVYGDSITQGYDEHYPSFSYINRVADFLDMEMVNKAVGGDMFSGEMASYKDDFVPDRIFVAYGTNDWCNKKRDAFELDARSFFQNLSGNYPSVPIDVLLPIWRGDWNHETYVGTFESARGIIANICKCFPHIRLIDGLPLIPHLEQFFEDYFLHPNDMGSLVLADGVCRELQKELKK